MLSHFTSPLYLTYTQHASQAIGGRLSAVGYRRSASCDVSILKSTGLASIGKYLPSLWGSDKGETAGVGHETAGFPTKVQKRYSKIHSRCPERVTINTNSTDVRVRAEMTTNIATAQATKTIRALRLHARNDIRLDEIESTYVSH